MKLFAWDLEDLPAEGAGGVAVRSHGPPVTDYYTCARVIFESDCRKQTIQSRSD